MGKMKYFDNEFTADEYVKMRLESKSINIVTKADLYKLIDKLGIEYDEKEIKKLTKGELLDFISQYKSYKELALDYGIGAKSIDYQINFDITHGQVKTLEKLGYLNVIGTIGFKNNNGLRLLAPLYDIYQMCDFTQEEINEILAKNEVKNKAEKLEKQFKKRAKREQ